MRQQNQQNKRMRGRGRKISNPVSKVYESNGPDVKIRGPASLVAEKYLTLARDAHSSGDPVSAENYLQHAEHYFRIISSMNTPSPQQPSLQQPSPQQPSPQQPSQQQSDSDGGELNGTTAPADSVGADSVGHELSDDKDTGAQADEDRNTASAEATSPRPSRRRGPNRKPRQANGADGEPKAAPTSNADDDAPGVAEDADTGVENPTESIA